MEDILRKQSFGFVCRTDIRGYYRHIDKDILFRQLQRHVRSPALLNLLRQFLHYSVEDGGTFHTPEKGIPRACALSPLLAAFHLYETDSAFERQLGIRYIRYMDDFLIFTRTRWQLRRAVKLLNVHFAKYGFEQHPDKTFIGRTEKGFDWLGLWFTDKGATGVAPRAVNNFLTKLRRLYEQTRNQPARTQAERVAGYLRRWLSWVGGNVPATPGVNLTSGRGSGCTQRAAPQPVSLPVEH
nr:reverse transcriptase domain-containing protein [Lelliottia aquatilis]